MVKTYRAYGAAQLDKDGWLVDLDDYQELQQKLDRAVHALKLCRTYGYNFSDEEGVSVSYCVDEAIKENKGTPEPSPPMTADGALLKEGMEVWCASAMTGFPPELRTVHSLHEDGFFYGETDRYGQYGCKCSESWVNPHKAMLHALGEKVDFHARNAS